MARRRSCQSHCPWCEGNRTHKFKRAPQISDWDDLEGYLERPWSREEWWEWYFGGEE